MRYRTRQKNKRVESKLDSNDSPEIPDKGETSDIPGLPSRSGTKTPPDHHHHHHQSLQTKEMIDKLQWPSLQHRRKVSRLAMLSKVLKGKVIVYSSQLTPDPTPTTPLHPPDKEEDIPDKSH